MIYNKLLKQHIKQGNIHHDDYNIKFKSINELIKYIDESDNLIFKKNNFNNNNGKNKKFQVQRALNEKTNFKMIEVD